MKIAFFEITEFEKEKYLEYLPNMDLKFFSQTINNVDSSEYSDCNILSVFIYSKVSSDIMAQCGQLKMISTRSTGTDHIDKLYCEHNGIVVKNVPLYGENTVAEHTFALLLALSRKVKKSLLNVSATNFSTEGLQGFDLKDKTIGIIGGGRIGLHVARMAKSFDMNVIVYDLKKDDFMSSILGFKYVSLDKLYKEADIISLHIPLNEHTYHFFNNETFMKMKDGVVILNTARGALIDNKELLKAINSGKVASAGLDVLEGEEYLVEENLIDNPSKDAMRIIKQNELLFENENVIITPHNAFNSKEALLRIIKTTVENIKNI